MSNQETQDGVAIEPTSLLDAVTVERLFCLAILQEGTDVTARVLARFQDYRRRKDEVLAQIGCAPNAPDQARLQPSPEAGCSRGGCVHTKPSWDDDRVMGTLIREAYSDPANTANRVGSPSH